MEYLDTTTCAISGAMGISPLEPALETTASKSIQNTIRTERRGIKGNEALQGKPETPGSIDRHRQWNTNNDGSCVSAPRTTALASLRSRFESRDHLTLLQGLRILRILRF